MSNLKKFKNKKKGFTLIELIVVIAIIGILAAVLLPRFGGFTDKARENSAMSEAKAVYTTLEAYYAENGSYPPAAAGGAKPDETKVKDAKNFDNVKDYKSTAKDNEQLFKVEKGNIEVTCTADGKFASKKK